MKEIEIKYKESRRRARLNWGGMRQENEDIKRLHEEWAKKMAIETMTTYTRPIQKD